MNFRDGVLIFSAFLSGCHIVTRSEATHGVMSALLYSIHQYAVAEGKLPASLEDLRAVGEGRFKDAWGHSLHYEVTADGVMTLMSLGRDGKPGGTGDDSDIVLTYLSRRKDGSFWPTEEGWMFEARKVTANDVIGMWTLSDESLQHLPADLRRRSTKLILEADGTFKASDLPGLFYAEPGPIRLDGGSGIWKLDPREGAPLHLEVHGGPGVGGAGRQIETSRSWRPVNLSYRVGGPDGALVTLVRE